MNDLRAELRSALAAGLDAEGWRLLDRPGRFEIAELLRPISTDFAATAVVGCPYPGGRDRLVVTHVNVGVSYGPLRRLWPLLGERYRFTLLNTDDEEAFDEDGEDPNDENGAEPEPLFVVTSSDQVETVAAAISELIAQRLPLAERIASVDALVKSFGDFEWARPEIPALLGAARRFDEARALLDEGDYDARFTHQLRRWLDSGGDPALIPEEPLDEPYLRPSFGERYAEIRREARLRSEALDAVRRAGRGRSRDELGAMLVRELAQRGLEVEPVRLEMMLDQLWNTKADQAKATVQILGELGRVGLGIAKAIRKREIPDLNPPEWLGPPDEACYAVRTGEGWVGVELDPDAATWLEEAHAALHTFFGIGLNLEAWLTPDGPGMVVHIGQRAVGRLTEANAVAYQAAMEAAQFREELPAVKAHLGRRTSEPHFVLELARPRS